MLLVKTKIGPSKIAGIGLFADEDIKAGTPVWKYEEDYDLKISKNKFDTLPDVAQKQLLNYAYFEKDLDLYILCGDDARFFNHSEKPNVDSKGLNEIDRANRDIKTGEELTQNYTEFDQEASLKLSN